MSIDIRDAIAELKSVRLSLPKVQQLPDDGLISAYERDLGILFSDEYKLFAKEASDSIYNGKDALRLTPGRDSPRELMMAVVEARKQGVSRSWLPICEDNGNYYCILEDGSVSYWLHDGQSDETWPDLASWIKFAWIEGD